ncbi:uncharacterized protein LOC107404179 [Ziziphus jujuba]|uniref:Uncharacterized protein LOC107404179 n=1 Tax=Ziziphus jujuba TaxID=326968 RepID=A0ABM4A2V6_ZIZJJ|nr:uncharacterized protein LOC107404179 [Ziziphus jujuba]
MEENLKTAAENGDINMIYISLSEDPYLLDNIDHVPFIHTPLHIAVSSSYHVQFAKEIMRLKPSFAQNLNQEGFRPIHSALHNGQTIVVLGFLNTESELVLVQGREGSEHPRTQEVAALIELKRQVRETLLHARALDAPGGVWQDDNNNISTNNTLNITLLITTSNLNNTTGISEPHQAGMVRSPTFLTELGSLMQLILSKNGHQEVIPIFREWAVIESSGNKDLKNGTKIQYFPCIRGRNNSGK